MLATKKQLKIQLEQILELLETENEEIIVTDQGKPVIKLSKYQTSTPTKELFAPLRSKVKYYED